MNYVTLTELNEIAKQFYMDSDKALLEFTKLSENNKQVLINRATVLFNSIPWNGHKIDPDQALAFPRDFTERLFPIRRGVIHGVGATIPQEVKQAVCFEIIDNLATDTNNDALQRGVQSVSISGAISESYDLNFLKQSETRYYGLKSKRAYDLIAQFVGGVYCVL